MAATPIHVWSKIANGEWLCSRCGAYRRRAERRFLRDLARYQYLPAAASPLATKGSLADGSLWISAVYDAPPCAAARDLFRAPSPNDSRRLS